jgi:hypothetical protein
MPVVALLERRLTILAILVQLLQSAGLEMESPAGIVALTTLRVLICAHHRLAPTI